MKPPPGEACNGCGVCCLAEPCPVGVVISGRLTGPCRALRWDAMLQLYRCGVLGAAAGATHARRSAWLARARATIVGRWIAAGEGCDCSLEVASALPSGSAHAE